MNEPLHEKIVLTLDASGVKDNSLSGLITQLEQVESHVRRVNAALQGLGTPPAAARTAAQLEAQIKAMQTRLATQGGLTGGNLAKGLKLEEQAFKEFITRNEQVLKGFRAKTTEFINPGKAAAAVAQFEKEQVRRFESMAQTQRAALADLLKPTVAQVSPQLAANAAIKTDGLVTLSIPAAQVQASVVGPIQLNIPGAQIVGGAPAGGRDPVTGKFTGGGGGKKKKASIGPLEIGDQAGELQRVRTQTDKYLRETIATLNEAGELVTTVHDSMEGIIKTSQKRVTGSTPLAQFRAARRLEEENFKQLKAAIDPGDPGIGLARLQKKQAAQLSAMKNLPFMKQLAAPQREQIERMLDEQARTLEAQSIETFRKAQDWRQYGMANVKQRLPQPRVAIPPWMQGFNSRRPIPPSGGAPVPPTPSAGGLVRLGPSGLAGGARGANGWGAGGPPPTNISAGGAGAGGAGGGGGGGGGAGAGGAGSKPPVNPFARGLKNFTPTGFAANLLNVAGWAAAVTVLYKSVELASYSMSRFMAIGQQTARLGQVFRGVGGNAKELTQDILKLASANGRDTEQTMSSAQEWSRLGLTRKQVNEAVRVSAVAANVADMHMSETTKQLMSLSHIYNLQISDLSGVLGMLTSTSQRYNVTLEDLFHGLDRSAGAAKLAKMPLAELQGMIAVGVGKSGQSGVTVGNTIKSMLVQFSNPDVQKYLRQFGIETLTNKGGQKGGSQILREMATRWQSLDERQQQSLTWRLVGRQNASRFTPLMENYVEGQKLAIDSQLRLNQAQATNAQIMATMKAQLAGVRAEWDRLVVKAAPDMTNMIRGVKDLMRALNGEPKPPRPAEDFRKKTDKQLNQSENWFEQGALDEQNRRWFQQRRKAGKSTSFLSWASSGDKGGLTDYLKHRYETPLELGIEELGNQEQKHQMAAEAHGMKARLFETVAQMVRGARDLKSEGMRENSEVVASEMDPASADVFKKAFAAGDRNKAAAVLGEQAKAARSAATGELMAKAKAAQDVYADAKGQGAALRQEIQMMQAKGASVDELTKKQNELSEVERHADELRQRSLRSDSEAYETVAGDLETVMELQQNYLNLLEQTNQVMGAIDELALQGGMETAGAKLDARVASLDDQLKLLNEQRDAMADQPGAQQKGTEANQVWMRLTDQLKEKEAQRAALDSAPMRELTGRIDDRALAQRRAKAEADSFSVGRTEADRLLNEERRLQQELNALRTRKRTTGLTENEAVRAKQLEISLWQTQEAIQMRIVDLSRQEKQIRLDAQREFSKNLLLAGPGEQLQRLYVTQLARRPVNAGEFNALSPEAKRMYYDLQGGEAGAIARQEQAALRNRGQTVTQQQSAQRGARERVGEWNAVLGQFTRGGAASGVSSMEKQAQQSSVQIAAMGRAAGDAAAALARIPQIVNALVKQNPPANQPSAPAPRLGISSGFSLGSQPQPHVYRPRDATGNVTGEYVVQ